MAQLKTYYFDYASALEESPFMYELLGLNLLCLLSQNRIAEFHMELERLATNQLHDSIYIRYPVQLEQYLMEGAYNKVFLSKGNVPAPTYVAMAAAICHAVVEVILSFKSQCTDVCVWCDAGTLTS